MTYYLLICWTRAKKILLKELEKCTLLCHDCHYKYHYGEVKHGTLNMYRHYGCRCELCTKVQSEYCKDYRIRKKNYGSVDR